MQKHLIKLTFTQLFRSGVHIGYFKFFLNRKLKSYIFGYYNNFYIINLYYTGLQLKLVINIISHLAATNQQIFFIQSNKLFFLPEKMEKINRYQLYIYDSVWIHGFLTNFKRLRQHWFDKNMWLDKHFSQLEHVDYSTIKKSLGLFYYSIKFFPSLIIFFDNYSCEALKEAYDIGVPLAGVVDTHFKYFQYLNYSIVGNNKSYYSLFLYYNLFFNAILRGLQTECYKILSIS